MRPLHGCKPRRVILQLRVQGFRQGSCQCSRYLLVMTLCHCLFLYHNLLEQDRTIDLEIRKMRIATLTNHLLNRSLWIGQLALTANLSHLLTRSLWIEQVDRQEFQHKLVCCCVCGCSGLCASNAVAVAVSRPKAHMHEGPFSSTTIWSNEPWNVNTANSIVFTQ